MAKKYFLVLSMTLGVTALRCGGGDDAPPADLTGGSSGTPSGAGAPAAGRSAAGMSTTAGSGGSAGSVAGSGGMNAGGASAGGRPGAGGASGSASGGAGRGAGAGGMGGGGSGAAGSPGVGGRNGGGMSGGGMSGGRASGGAGSGGMTGSAGGCTVGSGGATFAEVTTILATSCGTGQCHPNSMSQHVNLRNTDNMLYSRLMGNVPNQNTEMECRNRPLVVPCAPDSSLIVAMIEADDGARAGCAIRMPDDCPQDRDCLSAADIEKIRSWIAAGAPM